MQFADRQLDGVLLWGGAVTRRQIAALVLCALVLWGAASERGRATVDQVVSSIVATTCTSQFVRSIAASGGATCATVGSGDLAASLALTTPNIGAATATSVNFGGQSLTTYNATTWTPTISTDATPGTPAYSIRVGSYEQIGRQVTVRFTVSLSGWTGSPTGNVVLTGLPVAAANTANDYGACWISFYTVTALAVSAVGLTAVIVANTSQIAFDQNGLTGTANLTAAQAGTTFFVIGGCSYHT